jgi:hypothetical protein
MAIKQISRERKRIYYMGLSLGAIGLLSFGSVFVSFALHFGDFGDFDRLARSMTTRAVVGMGLMIAGMLLATVGIRGAAGSGIVLDPEKARKDMEPWARMGGGILKDTLDEAGISIGQKGEEGLKFDEELRRLHKLREEGVISEQEYAETKQRILKET